MRIVLHNFKSFIVTLLQFCLLLVDHVLEGLVSDESDITSSPVDWQIRISSYLQVWIPKRLFTKCHLVSHEKYKHHMLTVLPILKLLNVVVIYLTNP